MEQVLSQAELIRKLARKFMRHQNMLYLGRGMLFPVALEGALKLKEISYVHAEGYPAAEMKHGPIALIDEDMPTMVVAPGDENLKKIINNIEEIKARKGIIVVIIDSNSMQAGRKADYVIRIPGTNKFLLPILAVIPLQLFAYYMAKLRGKDIDKPRNLAKSVVVE